MSGFTPIVPPSLRRITFAAGSSLAAARAEDPNAIDLHVSQDTTVSLGSYHWVGWSATVRVAFAPSATTDCTIDIIGTPPTPSASSAYEAQSDISGGDISPAGSFVVPGFPTGDVMVSLLNFDDPTTLTAGWVDVYLQTAR